MHFNIGLDVEYLLKNQIIELLNKYALEEHFKMNKTLKDRNAMVILPKILLCSIFYPIDTELFIVPIIQK